MRRILLILIIGLLPVVASAQAAGGAIKRPKTYSNRTQMLNGAKPKQFYDVTFECNVPNALLKIDGKEVGKTGEAYKLKSGSHTVTIEADEYIKYTEDVIVSAQKTLFRVELIRNVFDVAFTCNGQPRASLFIDGRKNGEADGHSVKLKRGKCYIQIVHEGYLPILDTLYIDDKSQQKCYLYSAKINPVITNYIDNMIFVEGGTFVMGRAKGEKSYNCEWDKPAHKVTLSSFYIGKTEVTKELWNAVMAQIPSSLPDSKKPVYNVDWDDCQQFICKLNIITGKKFRLPSEAEWEFAARGGNKSKGYRYSGSNEIDEVAWFNCDGPKEVKTKMPNELGLYDMSGNVWEWCLDFFGGYGKNPVVNPQGPKDGHYEGNHVLRGGDTYYLTHSEKEVTFRDPFTAGVHYYHKGFRIVL